MAYLVVPMGQATCVHFGLQVHPQGNLRFGLAAEGAAFINDFTRAGVLEKFKSALLDENNVGKADSEIFGQITTGMENIFVPQTEVPTVVASTTGFGETLTDGEVRQIMGLMV